MYHDVLSKKSPLEIYPRPHKEIPASIRKIPAMAKNPPQEIPPAEIPPLGKKSPPWREITLARNSRRDKRSPPHEKSPPREKSPPTQKIPASPKSRGCRNFFFFWTEILFLLSEFLLFSSKICFCYQKFEADSARYPSLLPASIENEALDRRPPSTVASF